MKRARNLSSTHDDKARMKPCTPEEIESMRALSSPVDESALSIARFDDPLTEAIIAAAIEVHRHLGAGLLESVYEECLCRELHLRGLAFERQRPVPVVYKGVTLECGHRRDVVVEGCVLLELKNVEVLQRLHVAQVLTYLKLLSLDVGLLINFNVPTLRQGIRRLTRNHKTSLSPCPDG